MLSKGSRDGSFDTSRRATSRTSGRRAGAIAVGCFAVLLAWVFFWPGAGPASAIVDHTSRVLDDIGLPARLLAGPWVEFALNVLVIVPVPLLAGWAGVRWSWERWTAYAFVTAIAVETIQGLVMPNRSAQFQDVAANTLGILLGALLYRLFVRWRCSRRDPTARGDRPLRP